MYKKRIALIDYDMSIIGGIENVTKNIANNLTQKYDVYVISLNNFNGKIAYKLNHEVKYIVINQDKDTGIRKTIQNIGNKLKKVIKENGIELAIGMGHYATFISILKLFGCKIKLIFADHGALINQLDDKTATYIRRFNSIFAKHIVVLTEKSKKDYEEIFKINASKITRIYNAIPTQQINKEHKYDICSNKLVTAGRFSYEKGFDLLIQIASELYKINQNWTWDLYGDGPEKEKILKMISEKHLEKNVILKGMLNSLDEIYKEYSIYVLTSYREGLPIVLLEAKVNKLPIVSFDIETGPNEIIENNINGFLIEKYNIQQMAININKLLTDTELRKNFSMNACNNISKFEEKEIVKEWIELIEKI